MQNADCNFPTEKVRRESDFVDCVAAVRTERDYGVRYGQVVSHPELGITIIFASRSNSDSKDVISPKLRRANFPSHHFIIDEQTYGEVSATSEELKVNAELQDVFIGRKAGEHGRHGEVGATREMAFTDSNSERVAPSPLDVSF